MLYNITAAGKSGKLPEGAYSPVIYRLFLILFAENRKISTKLIRRTRSEYE
jgi:hypothetical protein